MQKPRRTKLNKKILEFCRKQNIKLSDLPNEIFNATGITVSLSTIKRYMHSEQEDNMDQKIALMEYCKLTIDDFKRETN